MSLGQAARVSDDDVEGPSQVRLWLFVLTYNLGNFMRRLVLPEDMKHWTLSSLQTRLNHGAGGSSLNWASMAGASSGSIISLFATKPGSIRLIVMGHLLFLVDTITQVLGGAFYHLGPAATRTTITISEHPARLEAS